MGERIDEEREIKAYRKKRGQEKENHFRSALANLGSHEIQAFSAFNEHVSVPNRREGGVSFKITAHQCVKQGCLPLCSLLVCSRGGGTFAAAAGGGWMRDGWMDGEPHNRINHFSLKTGQVPDLLAL